MAEKIIIPGESYDRAEIIMQGTADRDRYMRRWPLHLPATHRKVYWWNPEGTRLYHDVIPAEKVTPEMVVIGERGKPAPPVKHDKPPVKHDNPQGQDRQILLEQLNALSDDDLATRAAEAGVSVTAGKKPKLRPNIIADIAEKELAQAIL